MAGLVLKFGGSSLATITKIQAVARRVVTIAARHPCVVVVSAMGDETDGLLQQAAALHPTKYPRDYDMLLATGEQKSIALMSMALRALHREAYALTGWQAKIQTTPQHAQARIIDIDTRVILECWKKNQIPVIAGFQGEAEGEITTLGRGGSDLTAVALAVALAADECQIFTDVAGVYSADPRIVSQALCWDAISYEMMLELASVGAQVLHHRAVALASKMNVNLRVLSTFDSGEGTMVTHQLKKMPTVSGIASQAGQVVFAVVYRDAAVTYATWLIFLRAHHVPLNTLHYSRYLKDSALLSFAVSAEHASGLQADIVHMLGIDLLQCDNYAAQTQISVVGLGVQSSERVVAALHHYLAEKNLPLRLMTSSELRISFYVDADQATQVMQELHAVLHLDMRQ